MAQAHLAGRALCWARPLWPSRHHSPAGDCPPSTSKCRPRLGVMERPLLSSNPTGSCDPRAQFYQAVAREEETQSGQVASSGVGKVEGGGEKLS